MNESFQSNQSQDKPDDAQDVFRFRKKSIQVSLSFEREDLGISPDYEGETSSVSRLGMGARVDPLVRAPADPEELEGRTIFVNFHVPWADTIRPKATIEMVGDSEDHRFRLYLGLTFDEEINLSRLISG